MPVSGNLLIVHLVEERPEGFRFVRSRGEWPLHITLVPWFTINDEAQTYSRLEEVASASAAFDVTVGALDMFGTHNDVPVNIVREQEKIKALHLRIVAALQELDAAFVEERWIGENYRAHITRHESQGRWCDEGEVENIDDFHLVRLIDDEVCEVVRRFVLEPSS